MAELVKSLSHRLQAALTDALLAGYVAFALFCLTLGFRTVDSAGGLTLKSRPMLLAIAVGSVFVGRLLLNSLVERQLECTAPGLAPGFAFHRGDPVWG